MDKATANRINTMLPLLNEKQRRLYLAAEADGLGHGGIKEISKFTGVSKTTIIAGKKENKLPQEIDTTRIRKTGGGRKSITDINVGISSAIENLVKSDTFGNPENPLMYTTKSLRNLEKELKEQGFEISHDTIGNILKTLNYSLQLNQKMLQVGKEHPDRDKQFEFINEKSSLFISQNEPVISVDTKKKELIGNFKNNGSEYAEKKNPIKVLDHDFPIEELGKVAPYGIYDINKNEGFVNLGLSKDTSEFAVNSILRWWQTLGKPSYPNATKLYINCDGGGSNGSRVRLWKQQLQEFTNITGLEVHISHFPPGTSKWNKIEHRMFCFISKNWRGKPLISVETVISLISNTTTKKGLKIVCQKDETIYELSKVVTNEELLKINLKRELLFGNWNYVILPII